eukprot:2611612-Rhodomonas_salina.1
MFQYDRTDSESAACAANCAHELLYSSMGQTIWYVHMTEGVRFCEVSANTALSAIKPPSEEFLPVFIAIHHLAAELQTRHPGTWVPGRRDRVPGTSGPVGRVPCKLEESNQCPSTPCTHPGTRAPGYTCTWAKIRLKFVGTPCKTQEIARYHKPAPRIPGYPVPGYFFNTTHTEGTNGNWRICRESSARKLAGKGSESLRLWSPQFHTSCRLGQLLLVLVVASVQKTIRSWQANFSRTPEMPRQRSTAGAE